MLNILSDITLITYGGGDILEKVFNAIVMLMNGGKDGFLYPLAGLCATLTAVFVLSKAMYSGSMEHLLSKFLFPVIGLFTILMIPKTTVKIEDVLIPSYSRTVDNVPFLLGQFASIVSSASYKVTVALESKLHSAQDGVGGGVSYDKTGMLFGAEAAVDLNKFKIINGDLEYNLGEFSKQCVLYDVALGMYSIDQLKKSTDLWGFFEKNTSILRMINYKTLDRPTDATKTGSLFALKTCREAIKEMKKSLGKEIEYFEKSDMIKNLPFVFGALTKISKTQENLVGQQIMMQALSERFNGGDLAKSRADSHQKSYMNIVGSLASKSIIGTRIFFEALIYVCFVLIIPLTFLPGGFKFISSWAWCVVWIQTWPPFFAIINYIMLISARSNSFGQNSYDGLSFFTSVGIESIQDQVFAMGGFLAASVPFITHALLKGGLHSIGSLASNIMSPISGAASMAASEQVSGNYSIGNVSMGNLSHQNEGSYQTNVAPSLQSDKITANEGTDTLTYTSDDRTVHQGNSSTLTSFFSDDMNSQSLNKALSHSIAATTANEASYNESVSAHERNTANLIETLSRSENYNDSLSEGKTCDIQSSAADLMSLAERYGKNYGMSTKDSVDTLVGAHVSGGFSIFGSGGGVEARISKSSGDDFNEHKSAAQDIANSEEFRESFQKVDNFVKNQGASYLVDEAKRTSHDYSKSCDDVKSSQEAYRTSLSTTNQLSDNVAHLKQVAQHVKYDQTKEFGAWLVKNDKMSHDEFYSVLKKGSDAERVNLLNNFVDFNKERHPSLSQEYTIPEYKTPENTYKSGYDSIKKIDHNTEREKVTSAFLKMNESENLQKGEARSKRDLISHNNKPLENQVEKKQAKNELKIDSSLNKMQLEFSTEANRFLVGRALEHYGTNITDIPLGLEPYDKNTFNIKERPFYHKGYK